MNDDVPETGVTVTDDSSESISPKELLGAFADRLKFEHDVMNHRLGWLMTLNGFLVGGSAILAANKDKFGNNALIVGALLLICVGGAICNWSCFYSNVWADRAIRESASALAGAWTEKGTRDLSRLAGLARLYGRDSTSFADIKTDRLHLRDLLHPWLMLPAMFTVVFCFTGLFLERLVSEDYPLYVLSAPIILVLLFSVAGLSTYFHTGDRILSAMQWQRRPPLTSTGSADNSTDPNEKSPSENGGEAAKVPN